ncbi:MAG: phosphonate ABC transporter ATP-binding protein [Clostridia bacterium]|nr:phosphonate ABC transporter ATP-binding protein [Clostridia bacterium]
MIKSAIAIEFNNVYQTYKNPEDSVLRGVNLTINKSEFCIILGRSGMGKSTLLRCINGLVHHYEGTITVNGEKLEKNKTVLRKIRRKTGMIFQHYNLVNRLTALENVVCGMLPEMPFFRAMLGIVSDQERQKALALLDKVGLKDFADQRVDQLSGGQKQRVGIARALAQEPDIILADEPVASLDPVTSGEILELLKKIVEKDSITVVISLHQIELAKEYGERIIALLDGKLTIDKTASELTDADIASIYNSSEKGKLVNHQEKEGRHEISRKKVLLDS